MALTLWIKDGLQGRFDISEKMLATGFQCESPGWFARAFSSAICGGLVD
jgi:hypothetical protein